MIRNRLFLGFAVLVIAFGVVSALIGVSLIRDRVVKEAQTRVQSDLNSAWSVVNAELHRIEIIVQLAAGIQRVLDACDAESSGTYQEAQNRLEMLRMDYGLDFFGLISPRGQVIVRSTPPYNTGDFRLSNPVILRALRGETLTAIEVMSGEDLERGRMQCRRAIDQFAACLASGEWPGPGGGRRDAEYLQLPAWAAKRIDQQLEIAAAEANDNTRQPEKAA